MSMNEQEYQSLLVEFKRKYSSAHKAMYDYIIAEWVDRNDHRCNWQIFRNSVGLANTNSPIESFNKTLKEQFFERVIISLGAAIDKLDDIISYYSNNKERKFTRQPKFVKYYHELALTLTKNNFRVRSDPTKVKYTCEKNTYLIDLNDNSNYRNWSCSCKYFLKDGICMHLIGYSWLTDNHIFVKYPNPYTPKNFAINTKRGRQKTKKCGQFN